MSTLRTRLGAIKRVLIDELPYQGNEHKYDAVVLAHEVVEYAEADYLLCPSEFVERTFIERGTEAAKLVRHRYGYDGEQVRPGSQDGSSEGLVMIFVGLCTPRKGLHYALKAWLASDAAATGKFLICGDFVPGYRELLAEMLEHPSVSVLGHRNDVPELMRQADLFVLPTVEEGSALVTYEARGSGCVLVVSDASGAVCRHLENGLVHAARDADALKSHLNLLHGDRVLLGRLREASLASADQLTWLAAGVNLREVYENTLRQRAGSRP